MTGERGKMSFPSGQMIGPETAETGESGKLAGPEGKMAGELGRTVEIPGRKRGADQRSPGLWASQGWVPG